MILSGVTGSHHNRNILLRCKIGFAYKAADIGAECEVEFKFRLGLLHLLSLNSLGKALSPFLFPISYGLSSMVD